MGSVQNIPTLGFIRGAIVRDAAGGPNMLVVRGLGERTVVVVCEADEGGNLRLRDYTTADLIQVLEAGPYDPTPPKGETK